jgi:DNA-binding NtrC family response regulator
MKNAVPRILVVDDEQAVLDLLVYNLGKAHYEVLTAVNGRQALDLARKAEPDLILDLAPGDRWWMCVASFGMFPCADHHDHGAGE